MVPVAGGLGALVLVATAPAGDRIGLAAAAVVAAAAGLSATSIGVFGGVLVPGLLLLGVPPAVAAPLSLLLQVVVIPLGATTHAAVGHVKRAITVPLIVGGVTGSIAGALLASSVPADLVARAVSFVIVVVGLVVLANVRNGYAAGRVDHEQVHPGTIGSIGGVAGFASGISGAGWGPIGVKLLILSGLEPRHAIGSSLVGRVAMAVAAIATYAAVAIGRGGIAVEPRLFAVLLCASAAAMVPGTMVIAKLGRGRAAVGIAILSIALALPTLVGGP
ncbi:MAG TPA: sulfite exporter TauE/SafE family protein [Candidatus Limnocylindrales bacterium]|nr:sulfite exporter TauE/SafE family protein [Candidatus Limnocylindrales bacterium]